MDARPAAKASPVPMILGIVGGAMLFIGSFLAWATVSIDVEKFAQALGVDPALLQGSIGQSSQSFSGMKDQSDGIFTLIAGLVVIALAVVLLIKVDLNKIMGALMIVAGAIGAGVALYDLSKVNDVKDQALGNASGSLQAAGIDPGVLDGVIKVAAGIGIYVCALGGIVAVVAGIMALMRKSTATPAAASSVGTSSPPAATGFDSSPPPAAPMPAPAAPEPAAPDIAAPAVPDMGTPSTPEPPATPDTGGAGGDSTAP